jgi:hypothetical protein
MSSASRAGPTEAKITANAYIKLHLHAAKYGSELVCGFLIGPTDDSATQTGIRVDDVLPICHSNPCGPIFEVAGAICASIFPEKQVVGLYYSSGDGNYNNRNSTPHFVDRLCDTIKANNNRNQCLVLTLNNSFSFKTDDDNLAVTQFLSNGKNEVSVSLLNAFLMNSNANVSQSSSGRHWPKLDLNTATTTRTGTEVDCNAKTINELLDRLLLNRAQYNLEDVQSHMAGVSDSGVNPLKNLYVNLACNTLREL